MYDFATYFAWAALALILMAAAAMIVWLGTLPGKIAAKRNHPQVDAINACSWIGLAMAGAGWPIAFVWAFLKSGPIGSSGSGNQSVTLDDRQHLQDEIARMSQRIVELEQKLNGKHV